MQLCGARTARFLPTQSISSKKILRLKFMVLSTGCLLGGEKASPFPDTWDS